ncbi:MAG TPA: NAD-dependent epimerase/dehydratase family protein [Polyangiaceae bacterium]|nr:NAD-dependent epimerase/dehydratase family protein [Polyangiaceae bacterium]
MKLLLLGGTRFLGRHTLDSALARGHEVTLFNRGRNNAGLPPEVELLTGDRDGNLEALRGRSWDAVIDTSGYIPRVVAAGAELLAGAARHYVFVSSISVYPTFPTARMDETAPVGELQDPTVEEVTFETYGPLKALCEREVERRFPGRAAMIRAGLIVGPRDDIGRFTYWVKRVAEGGEVLAPGTPDRQIQVIDARDIADWMVKLAEDGRGGIFNTTGPDKPLTMGELLDACRRVSGSDARFSWASDAFLAEHKVEPFSEMPVYVPDDGPGRNLFDIDVSRAIEAGLRFRPLEDSIRDTLEWTEPPLPREFVLPIPPPGISREREAELLAELAKRST